MPILIIASFLLFAPMLSTMTSATDAIPTQRIYALRDTLEAIVAADTLTRQAGKAEPCCDLRSRLARALGNGDFALPVRYSSDDPDEFREFERSLRCSKFEWKRYLWPKGNLGELTVPEDRLDEFYHVYRSFGEEAYLVFQDSTTADPVIVYTTMDMREMNNVEGNGSLGREVYRIVDTKNCEGGIPYLGQPRELRETIATGMIRTGTEIIGFDVWEDKAEHLVLFKQSPTKSGALVKRCGFKSRKRTGQ